MGWWDEMSEAARALLLVNVVAKQGGGIHRTVAGFWLQVPTPFFSLARPLAPARPLARSLARTLARSHTRTLAQYVILMRV